MEVNLLYMNQIKYYSGVKYVLAETYQVQISIYPHETIIGGRYGMIDYIQLSPEGLLTIKEGYPWDGPSGPTIDTKNAMRGSLIYDALYQFFREGKLPRDYRPTADRILAQICMEDGMTQLRADIWYEAIRVGAILASYPEGGRKLETAP